jgi:hypothetical protein
MVGVRMKVIVCNACGWWRADRGEGLCVLIPSGTEAWTVLGRDPHLAPFLACSRQVQVLATGWLLLCRFTYVLCFSSLGSKNTQVVTGTGLEQYFYGIEDYTFISPLPTTTIISPARQVTVLDDVGPLTIEKYIFNASSMRPLIQTEVPPSIDDPYLRINPRYSTRQIPTIFENQPKIRPDGARG